MIIKLQKELIRIGYEKPELRDHLRPILNKIAGLPGANDFEKHYENLGGPVRDSSKAIDKTISELLKMEDEFKEILVTEKENTGFIRPNIKKKYERLRDIRIYIERGSGKLRSFSKDLKREILDW